MKGSFIQKVLATLPGNHSDLWSLEELAGLARRLARVAWLTLPIKRDPAFPPRGLGGGGLVSSWLSGLRLQELDNLVSSHLKGLHRTRQRSATTPPSLVHFNLRH